MNWTWSLVSCESWLFVRYSALPIRTTQKNSFKRHIIQNGGWNQGLRALHCTFLLKKFCCKKKCTFSWDLCIEFARTYEKNPAEETFMDIFSSTISRRIGYLSKIKHYISAKNCILQRVLKSERIWSNFCSNLISFVLRLKKCVSQKLKMRKCVCDNHMFTEPFNDHS